MATYTDNYHLEKPAQSDLYNIDVFNGNADIIDAAMASKALAQNQATIEPTNSASRNYAKGEFLVYNGLLYKVTASISSGVTIAPGTNCVATNTGTELKALNDSLTPNYISITNPTLPTGFTLHGLNYVIKVGRLCYYRISIKMVNPPSGSNGIYNYFPAGYRPLYDSNAYGETGLGDGKLQPIGIYTDGHISIFPTNTGTTYAIATGVFVTEN